MTVTADLPDETTLTGLLATSASEFRLHLNGKFVRIGHEMFLNERPRRTWLVTVGAWDGIVAGRLAYKRTDEHDTALDALRAAWSAANAGWPDEQGCPTQPVSSAQD